MKRKKVSALLLLCFLMLMFLSVTAGCSNDDEVKAVASGIQDVILITGWQKRAIEDHFDRSAELEKFLESQGKTQALDTIKKSLA